MANNFKVGNVVTAYGVRIVVGELPREFNFTGIISDINNNILSISDGKRDIAAHYKACRVRQEAAQKKRACACDASTLNILLGAIKDTLNIVSRIEAIDCDYKK